MSYVRDIRNLLFLLVVAAAIVGGYLYVSDLQADSNKRQAELEQVQPIENYDAPDE